MTAAWHFSRYISVALLAAAGDWLVFILLASVVGLAPLASLMTARVAGGLMSFLGNRYWTWGANRHIALTQQGRRFLLLYAFSYALSVALFWLLTAALRLPIYPSKVATDLTCFAVNFLVMKSYVFHSRSGLAKFFARGQRAANAVRRTAAERAAFWNGKILGWEASRYSGGPVPGLVEGLAGRVSSSLRFRLDTAARLLTPHLAGRRVVELGCGSGLLAEKLLALGAASYQGYDLSDTAIARAQQRAAASPRRDDMRFTVAELAELPPQGDALIVSLGLIEWLTPAELEHLFDIGRHGSCLHAISERNTSMTQLIHRAYVHFSYGRKSGGYVPQYHAVEEIAAIANRHGVGRLNVYRHRRLRFGVLLSDLRLD